MTLVRSGEQGARGKERRAWDYRHEEGKEENVEIEKFLLLGKEEYPAPPDGGSGRGGLSK